MSRLLIVFFCILVVGCSTTKIKFSGQTNYSHQLESSMVTEFKLDFKLKLFKFNNLDLYLAGTINPEYDHFLNNIKTNSFTGISIFF